MVSRFFPGVGGVGRVNLFYEYVTEKIVMSEGISAVMEQWSPLHWYEMYRYYYYYVVKWHWSYAACL